MNVIHTVPISMLKATVCNLSIVLYAIVFMGVFLL